MKLPFPFTFFIVILPPDILTSPLHKSSGPIYTLPLEISMAPLSKIDNWTVSAIVESNVDIFNEPLSISIIPCLACNFAFELKSLNTNLLVGVLSIILDEPLQISPSFILIVLSSDTWILPEFKSSTCISLPIEAFKVVVFPVTLRIPFPVIGPFNVVAALNCRVPLFKISFITVCALTVITEFAPALLVIFVNSVVFFTSTAPELIKSSTLFSLLLSVNFPLLVTVFSNITLFSIPESPDADVVNVPPSILTTSLNTVLPDTVTSELTLFVKDFSKILFPFNVKVAIPDTPSDTTSPANVVSFWDVNIPLLYRVRIEFVGWDNWIEPAFSICFSKTTLLSIPWVDDEDISILPPPLFTKLSLNNTSPFKISDAFEFVTTSLNTVVPSELNTAFLEEVPILFSLSTVKLPLDWNCPPALLFMVVITKSPFEETTPSLFNSVIFSEPFNMISPLFVAVSICKVVKEVNFAPSLLVRLDIESDSPCDTTLPLFTRFIISFTLFNSTSPLLFKVVILVSLDVFNDESEEFDNKTTLSFNASSITLFLLSNSPKIFSLPVVEIVPSLSISEYKLESDIVSLSLFIRLLSRFNSVFFALISTLFNVTVPDSLFIATSLSVNLTLLKVTVAWGFEIDIAVGALINLKFVASKSVLFWRLNAPKPLKSIVLISSLYPCNTNLPFPVIPKSRFGTTVLRLINV